MDENKTQSREVPALRAFRICLDRPDRPTTILGVIRRASAEANGRPTTRPTPSVPRRFNAFA